ncbi:esterase/lipase family protein [Polaribacter cellanae]|uniref:DUF676 domain-containing protein n=1 Tax=Polaribacter cellanae TaxID=2818493 RepID=A0A975CNH5_9FLAO|nr:hypothetical protein [Polaribacter cellanae]QTE22327.1 hypothetical protein J3359_16200 [Polaribacter cellanae]
MKKITLCICLSFIALQLKAQTTLEKKAQTTLENYTKEVDAKLQNIDKSPITSNILLDRVISVSSIVEFNQGARQDTTSFSHFKQVWYELNRASYVQNIPKIEVFNDELLNKNYNSNTIPIGIINTEFHYGDAGTTQNPNIQFNATTKTFSNIPNKTPFIKKQTTIISPLIEEATGSTIQFKTDAYFKLHKFGKKIKTLQLQTNGSNFTLINNYNFTNINATTTYTTKGIKNLKFVATFSDNTKKTSYGKFYLNIPTTYLAKSNTSPLEEIFADSDLYFQGYDENKAYQGKNEYRIYYNDDAKILDKPIIIVDGFDPSDTRKIEEFDEGHNENEPSILELMSYKLKNGDNVELINDLNKLGYDVIIVNHPKYKVSDGINGNRTKQINGGGDYIQRNAYVLISLIRKLKQQQEGKEKMVVIGPSMGGLITRYALAYMEKKLAETGDHTKWNHNTRLWVSFDSPHQGANIPIGTQYWLRFHSFLEKVKENLEVKINSVAAKQMLVHHHLSGRETPQGAPNFRNRFQNELDALGTPQNLRKIALNNGSILGETIGIPSQEILSMKINPDVASRIVDIILFGPLLDFEGIHSNIYFTPKKNTKSLIFDGRVRVSTFFINWSIYRERHYTNSDGRGSYDTSPGSFFYTQNIIYNDALPLSQHSFDNWLMELFIELKRSIKIKEHSFIPTKSALAYTGSNVLGETIGNQNRVCTGQTPFDSYFAPNKNEEHITLTKENVAWLTEEIKGNKQLPIPNSTTPHISNREALCINTKNKVTFYLNECASPKATSWAVSPDLQIVSTTDYTAIVKPIGNKITNTPSKVIATLANGKTVVKEIRVIGEPTITFPDTSLRDAILAGTSAANYPNVTITNKHRIPVDINFANRINWKHTIEIRNKGIENNLPPEFYYPCTKNHSPATLASIISANFKAATSVKDLVPLLKHHFVKTYKITDMSPNLNENTPESLLREYALEPQGFSPIIEFEGNGLIEVEVTATNECGCATNTNVYKTPKPKPFFDFTIYPNPIRSQPGSQQIGINLTRGNTEDNPVEKVSCYVTLTEVSTGKDVLKRSFVFDKNKQFVLLDIGKDLSSGTTTTLQLAPLDPGVYIFKISSARGNASKKLIVEL